MNDKLIILLALDSMLVELDKDYEEIPEEQYNLINSKVLESYGLTIHSTKAEISEINKLVIEDVKKYRDRLLAEFK